MIAVTARQRLSLFYIRFGFYRCRCDSFLAILSDISKAPPFTQSPDPEKEGAQCHRADSPRV